MSEFEIRLSPPRGKHRSREGCWTCRKRKKKCNSVTFPCSSCSRLGLECERGVRLVWEDDSRRSGMKRRGPPKSEAVDDSKDGPYKGDSNARPNSTDGTRGRAEENSSLIRAASPVQRTTGLSRISSWPFELDATESILLDHYIQRFSRTYPTFSGPTNPFLRIFLPLAMESRIVLDALLALGGVQSWYDGNFTLKNAMLTLRQKALRGCRALVTSLGTTGVQEVQGDAVAIRSFLNGTQDLQGATILHLLTSCVLLLLYEKLGGAGHENGSSHLQFFAQLLPAKLVVQAMEKLGDENVPDHSPAQSFQFVSNLFLYNDLVRSTSLRRSTLSNFYLSQTDTDAPCLDSMLQKYGPFRSHGRFAFPRLIARITAGDLTVTEAEIADWDGSLGWLPSLALAPMQETHEGELLPLTDQTLIMDPCFRRLDSFNSLDGWSEQRIISDLYRIAAIIYRRQCILQSTLETAGEDIPMISVEDALTGNLPCWATQLIDRLPQGSVFENTLLWPIGIIAKELTRLHGAERESIISRLGYLEKQFQMKHFATVREYLIKYWTMSDEGIVYQGTEEILFG